MKDRFSALSMVSDVVYDVDYDDEYDDTYDDNAMGEREPGKTSRRCKKTMPDI